MSFLHVLGWALVATGALGFPLVLWLARSGRRRYAPPGVALRPGPTTAVVVFCCVGYLASGLAFLGAIGRVTVTVVAVVDVLWFAAWVRRYAATLRSRPRHRRGDA